MLKLLKKLVGFVVAIIIVLIILGYIDVTQVKNELLMKIYKIDYTEYVEKYSTEYDVDKYLIYAIIKAESNFEEEAKSTQEAQGLMQLMYSTAEELAEQLEINLTEENISDPDINIHLGTYYISILINKYENINLALAAYNAGSGNVDSWIEDGTLSEDGSNIENIPYTETNNYVRKILRDYKIYEKLYEENE